ncbi:hypothetical protein EYF80_047459 [Liparis tanakae]|uniref:Uncharacterized protein n=1 Tax=Liparis tanakae TaxID=230148 RepID=A0A4Z2FNK0_9TELE|nr:hypothetical protein EYF80_047459 [Liparis tanakae]
MAAPGSFHRLVGGGSPSFPSMPPGDETLDVDMNVSGEHPAPITYSTQHPSPIAPSTHHL